MENLTIDRNGWLFKFAYPEFFNNERRFVKRVNLCRFFWRCVGMTILWVFMLILMAFLWVFMGIIMVILILTGYKPIIGKTAVKKYKEEYGDESHVPLMVANKKWPHIMGHRIGIFHLLLIPILYYSLPAISELSGKAFNDINWNYIFATFFTIVLLLLCALVVIFTFVFVIKGYLWIRESEIVRILKLYLKSKKEKICPIIEVVDRSR